MGSQKARSLSTKSGIGWLGPSTVVPTLIRTLITLIPIVVLSLVVGCASTPGPEPVRLIYTPEDFRTTLRERAPGLSEALIAPPFSVSVSDIEKAEARTSEAPLGPDRVRALVSSLSAAEPLGFGLEYDWLSSTSASRTLETRRGNCVALASVLVGLGRGLGWPIYYAEARAKRPETHEYDEVTFVSDHMVVIVAAKSFQMIIDFTGQVDEMYELKAIDDLTAYAHVINNVAGQRVAQVEGGATQKDWEIALTGFELASRIQPELGRAWNNRGIALTRLGRFAEAEEAYRHALALEMVFDSASHNLAVMKTRALGKTTVAEEPVSR